MHAKCVIQDNDEVGIWPNKTYLALTNEVGRSSNLGYSENDVRNYIDVDTANKFRSALWIDARCMASYEYYGDMVSFDTTYSKNKHGLPSASFVGVNHHRKSTLLGCALLGNEKICIFENVFPNIRHWWCIWHILKKILHKFEGYARYREIHATMTGIVWNACSVECFEKDWATFIVEFNLEHTRWLSDFSVFMMVVFFVDLYDDRRIWNFVTCEEEASMLHSGLDELRDKLFDYRANLESKSVPTTQNGMVTQRKPALSASNIQGLSKVATKKNDETVNPNLVVGSAVRANESQEHGGFISLLNSFRNT
ncbi:protein FAR1-RELATED SEQUENCE 5-like [Arachis duranensis]|uniref:Protein FAR1-RELATED SEQUENCE 5-like n=1 Tax=Arachis duranensis TaxID=130453 RepID=A0A6P4D000_ARADU|nr:protein FAR1-RELATED SEQUENCE 5-like [Arachis duranensis]XP_025692498.1 protein FAR1-RELATED SEQUENCE 5-like [Arachis hypogaea]